MIYLDNAATTFPKPSAVNERLWQLQRELSVNAGRGGYKAACLASQIMDETRHRMASYTGTYKDSDVVFTSSDTMAANIVLQGLAIDEATVIYVSPYEHNAIMRTLHAIREKTGCRIITLPVDESCAIDLKRTEKLFEEKRPFLICITQVSNVTGYILPFRELFHMAKKYDAVTLLDTAQGLGILPVHVIRDEVDFLLFAGHKNLYASFGVGGFINAADMGLQPIIFGGNGSDSLNLNLPLHGEGRYEIGSQNLPAIGALGTAVSLIEENHEKYFLHEQMLSGMLREKLSMIPGVVLFPADIETRDYTGIVSFACESYQSDEIGMILDEDFDIAVRTDYHCAPLVHEVIGSVNYGGTVRVSVGQFNTEEDVEALVGAVQELMEE